MSTKIYKYKRLMRKQSQGDWKSNRLQFSRIPAQRVVHIAEFFPSCLSTCHNVDWTRNCGVIQKFVKLRLIAAKYLQPCLYVWRSSVHSFICVHKISYAAMRPIMQHSLLTNLHGWLWWMHVCVVDEKTWVSHYKWEGGLVGKRYQSAGCIHFRVGVKIHKFTEL